MPSTEPPSTEDEKDKAQKRDLDRLKEAFEKQLHEEVRVSEDRERKILLAYDKMKKTNADQSTRLEALRAQYHKATSEKESAIAALREVDFERMRKSAHWQVRIDTPHVKQALGRVKTRMRVWANTVVISSLAPVATAEYPDLVENLSCVVALDGGQLPPGLVKLKSYRSMLLNALLAHDIYTRIFRSPFFWLDEEQLNDGPDAVLDSWYHRGQRAHAHNAHYWRSDMLRLFLPRVQRHDSTQGEKELYEITRAKIAEVAEACAFHFVKTPARHLIGSEVTVFSKEMKTLISVYQEAAELSCELWTERKTLRCCTLRDMAGLGFDPESSKYTIHPTQHGLDASQLLGRPITLIVHPLLESYGGDVETKDEDYNSGHVLVPAEVWVETIGRE